MSSNTFTAITVENDDYKTTIKIDNTSNNRDFDIKQTSKISKRRDKFLAVAYLDGVDSSLILHNVELKGLALSTFIDFVNQLKK